MVVWESKKISMHLEKLVLAVVADTVLFLPDLVDGQELFRHE